MSNPDEETVSFIGKRALRWLLLFYCLFILYGTFIPFSFSRDPAFVHSQWSRFFTPPFVNHIRHFSVLDVVSNVLLFVPFGFLWVGAATRLFRNSLVTCLGCGTVGFLFGLSIEAGQIFSPGRTTSILDALCNGFGSALGGTFGYIFLRGMKGTFGSSLRRIIQQQPSLLLLTLLMIAPLMDAFYPFQITLDVTTIWENLKRTQWKPFVAGFHRFWLDLLVEKILLFAAVGYLVVCNLRRTRIVAGRTIAWILCVAFAFCIEGGKLLFVGRVPNTENFLLASIGALLGILTVPDLAEANISRRYTIEILFALVFGVFVYSELSPFDWIGSYGELPARLAKVEWLPFASYYGADPQSALFDLGKKFFLVGPIGFLVAAWFVRNGFTMQRVIALAIGLLSAVVLEAVQIILRSRIPLDNRCVAFWSRILAGRRIV